MRVEVCVPEHWTSVSVGWQSISQSILATLGKDEGSTIKVVNNCHIVLRGIPDEFIAEMTDDMRKIVANALHEQASRYEVEQR